MKKYLTQLFEMVEKRLPYFVTIHARPKNVERVGVWSDTINNLPKIAIVIQGGLTLQDHFTRETVKIYKKLFPEVIIVVSTWEEEHEEEKKILQTCGAVVVENKKPTDAGQQNINMQLVSSLTGIKKAEELGAEYVLKTRTDQRMYAVNAIEFLYHACNAFALTSETKQQKRIVAVSLNSFKYRMYGVSDMNIFGTVNDVELYFSVPHDVSGDKKVGPASLPTPLCEVYLATSFLKSIGKEVKWTLEDSWSAWKDHFVVVDKESLDLYWCKYAHMREYRYPQYDAIKNNQEMNFREWLNIYMTEKRTIPTEGKIQKVIL